MLSRQSTWQYQVLCSAYKMGFHVALPWMRAVFLVIKTTSSLCSDVMEDCGREYLVYKIDEPTSWLLEVKALDQVGNRNCD